MSETLCDNVCVRVFERLKHSKKTDSAAWVINSAGDAGDDERISQSPAARREESEEDSESVKQAGRQQASPWQLCGLATMAADCGAPSQQPGELAQSFGSDLRRFGN